MSTCSHRGCSDEIRAKGLCGTHYMRALRGSPLDRPSPEQRFWAKVNKTETCWLWTGKANDAGYGRFCVDRKIMRAHRYSYEINVGPIPEGMEIDHQCHVELCVNPAHLLLCNRQVNNENRRGASTNNRSSGVRGVYPSRNGRWEAKYGSGGESFFVGTFDLLEDAEAAVIAARIEAMTNSDLGIRNRRREAA